PVNAFIITGFDKIFTKSVLKKNDLGNSTLSIDAGTQAFVIRYATTNLTLNQSSAADGLQLQTRSKLTVAGDISSSNAYVRLQNTGGNLETNNGITITAADFIDLTNASKSNLKSTFVAGTNSTYTADANGGPGAGNVSFTIDQKALRLDPPKPPKGQRLTIQREIPPPHLSGNFLNPLSSTINFRANVVNDGGVFSGGRRQFAFNPPENTANADGSDIVFTNNAKNGSMIFNGNVTVNASK
ncbi:hypothetical protein KF707_15115, partial [Candidatus Obscuribacterales bacterium]|nr:hypothetical protein [Candidatus Obscuribacterales bacterium]